MSDDDDSPPSAPSPSSPASRSDAASSAAPDSQFLDAATRAMRGAEYELRAQRQDIETLERLSRGGHEVTQGSIRALRVETDRQSVEVSAVRRHLGELLALVRSIDAKRIEVAPVTDSSSRWEQAGWRLPTPHQVLWVVMSAALGIEFLGLAPPGTFVAKVCQLVAWLCGSKGIELARNYVSPQLRAKADAFDARAIKELSEGGQRS